jgi:hypothetical protein
MISVGTMGGLAQIQNGATGARTGLSIWKASGPDQAQDGDSGGLAARPVAAELYAVFCPLLPGGHRAGVQ